MYKFSLFLLLFTFLESTDNNLNNVPTINKIATENTFTENDNAIKLLTLNTWGLPINLAGHDQKNRFTNMSSSINKMGADIICLQECFAKDLRNNLIQELVPLYNTHTNLNCNRSWMKLFDMDCNGGLLTLSSYPIIDEIFVPFEKRKKVGLIEKIGAKGFLLTTIDLGTDTLNIINTHMYSGNNDHAEQHRLSQIQQIENYLSQYLIRHPYNTMITGDFNIAHPDVALVNDYIKESITYDYMINELCLADSKPNLTTNDYTMDPNANPYSSDKDGGQQKLDYCMLLNCDQSSNIKFINSDVVLKNESAISDHMGLLTEISIGSGSMNNEIEELVIITE